MPVQTRRQKALILARSRINVDIIAHVASFLPIDDNSVMKMCLAVGRSESGIIRYTFLRSNFEFLYRLLEAYIDNPSCRGKCREGFLAWMEVNSDWRRLCTPDRTKSCSIISFPTEEEGKTRFQYNAAAIFNNPSVAIEFGLVDILRHLVENLGIDVNAYEWNNFSTLDHHHLLSYAMYFDIPCYEYLITVRGMNVGSKFQADSNVSLIHTASLLDKEYSEGAFSIGLEHFETLIQHNSFDQNIGIHALTLITQSFVDAGERSALRMEKARVLMKAGADPDSSGSIGVTPIEYAWRSLSRLEADSNGETGQILKELLVMMVEWTSTNRSTQNDDDE